MPLLKTVIEFTSAGHASGYCWWFGELHKCFVSADVTRLFYTTKHDGVKLFPRMNGYNSPILSFFMADKSVNLKGPSVQLVLSHIYAPFMLPIKRIKILP